jgi:hypothetical protein
MTDDRTAELLDAAWPPPDPAVVEREPRKCRRHEWSAPGMYVSKAVVTERTEDGYSGHYVPLDAEPTVRCLRCGKVRDIVRARRGKSSRRLGHDGERRSEKRYGWTKVGEFGGITDLQGTLAIVQQKTSRRAPPPAWMSIFRALEARAGGRIPLILLSFVKQGVDTEDFVVIRGRDWIALHGRDEPA